MKPLYRKVLCRKQSKKHIRVKLYKEENNSGTNESKCQVSKCNTVGGIYEEAIVCV